MNNSSIFVMGLIRYMASVSFFTRATSSKKDSEITIWLRYRDGRAIDIRVSTTETIPAKYWDSKRETIKAGTLPDSETQKRLEGIKERLSNIRSLIFDVGKTNREITPALFRETISGYLDSIKAVPRQIPSGILEYLGYLIPLMESGDYRYKGKPYSYNTIKVWKSFSLILERFLRFYHLRNGKALTWDSIDKAACDLFLSFLQGENYLGTSVNKAVINFRALVNMAEKDGLHSNYTAAKHFYKQSVREEDKTKRIYLTEKEVEALYQMDLEPGGLYDQVRDIFLCGCYTGQRISDYGRLIKQNFTETARGVKVVRLVQKKTDTPVTIPIINDHLLAIVKKYKGNLPHIHDQVLNREIKVILEMLSEFVPSLAIYENTTLTMKDLQMEREGKVQFERNEDGDVIMPRYELVTSHTARRTALTNLFLTKLFNNIQLMHVSGHKTEKAFLEYIRLSGDEIAESIDKILQRQRDMKNNDIF